jgi:hypothetical protein
MDHIEKARQKGEPIPKSVCQDNPETKPQPFDLQVSRLTRRYAISAAMAAIVAPFIFGESRA